MDQGIIVTTNRLYLHHFLANTVVVDDDVEADGGGHVPRRHFSDLRSRYSVKRSSSTLQNCLKKLLHDSNLEFDFECFDSTDFHQTFAEAGRTQQKML
jgi:hypothetical protein